MNKVYICVAPSKEVFNASGKSLGMCEERALYYCRDIGRRRIYRSSYPIPDDKCFKLLKYKSLKYAQETCDGVNRAYNDNFRPIEKLEGEEK